MPAPIVENVEDVQRVLDDIYDRTALSGATNAAALQPVGLLPGDYKWTASVLAQPGWLDCDGALYNTSQYPALARALGAAGATFNVPEVRGRVLVAAGAGPGLTVRALADILFGAETHQHQHIAPIGMRAGNTRVQDMGNGNLDWNGSTYTFMDTPGDVAYELPGTGGNSSERHVVTSTAVSSFPPAKVGRLLIKA